MKPKPIAKSVKVTVTIRSGPSLPAQKRQFARFWATLISQVQDEVKSEREPTIAKLDGPAQFSEEEW